MRDQTLPFDWPSGHSHVGALGPRPHDHVHLHGCWHVRHLSIPPRPYTNLTREVVSQIIGTGGSVEMAEATDILR